MSSPSNPRPSLGSFVCLAMPKSGPVLKQPHIPARTRVVPEGLDPAKMGKLAQRVEKILKDYGTFGEPKQLEPQTVLVAPANRDGAPPNSQHVHNGILKGFLDKGYDSTRPQIGICVEFVPPEGTRSSSSTITALPQVMGCSRGSTTRRPSTDPWPALI